MKNSPASFHSKAALGYLTSNNKVTFDCGGTLISESFIMAAAHCARQSRPPVVVRLGKVSSNFTYTTIFSLIQSKQIPFIFS